jgi:hypothetical protein
MRPDALVLSILSPEEDVTGDQGSVERGRNFISTSGVEDSSDDEDDGSGLEDSSCDILTVSVLQGSQVAPELSMSLRIRPRFKRLHTYIHAIAYAQQLHQPDSRRSAAAIPQRVPHQTRQLTATSSNKVLYMYAQHVRLAGSSSSFRRTGAVFT